MTQEFITTRVGREAQAVLEMLEAEARRKGVPKHQLLAVVLVRVTRDASALHM